MQCNHMFTVRFVTQICGMRIWLHRTDGSSSLQALQTPPWARIAQSALRLATVSTACTLYAKGCQSTVTSSHRYRFFISHLSFTLPSTGPKKSHLKQTMLISLTLQIIFTYTKYNVSFSSKSDIFNCLKRHIDLVLLPALHK